MLLENSVKLNLGCGQHILPGFTNIDNNVQYKDVVVENITALKSIHTDSVDFIYASHCLQCFASRKLVPIALVNWYRVLKRGGQIIIEVPTLVPLMTKYLNKEIPIETLIQGVYGVDEDGIRQTTCFDFDYLLRLLIQIGFKDVKQIEQPKYSKHDRSTNIVIEARK